MMLRLQRLASTRLEHPKLAWAAFSGHVTTLLSPLGDLAPLAGQGAAHLTRWRLAAPSRKVFRLQPSAWCWSAAPAKRTNKENGSQVAVAVGLGRDPDEGAAVRVDSSVGHALPARHCMPLEPRAMGA